MVVEDGRGGDVSVCGGEVCVSAGAAAPPLAVPADDVLRAELGEVEGAAVDTEERVAAAELGCADDAGCAGAGETAAGGEEVSDDGSSVGGWRGLEPLGRRNGSVRSSRSDGPERMRSVSSCQHFA